ncbi:MAG: polymerase beta domain protein region [Cyanobacteria bacterium RYN_339]|nr:polymerase beta domain protein region [Cyanobacteria bacterium RYN_339]
MVLETHLQALLEPRADVLAAWLGGSAASGRTDEHSDVDLVAIAANDAVEAVLAAIEGALPIALRLALPMPTWHGHAQRLYRVAGKLLDVVIMREDAPNRFLEPERHGTPVVLFDKPGLVRPAPLDPVAWHAKLRERVAYLVPSFDLLQELPRKAALRGLPMDAMGSYQTYTIRPLVELCRIKHCPWKYDFGLRYLERDLPADLHARLIALCYVADPADILAKLPVAEALFQEVLAGMDCSLAG